MSEPGKFDYTFKKESAKKIIDSLKMKKADPKKIQFQLSVLQMKLKKTTIKIQYLIKI